MLLCCRLLCAGSGWQVVRNQQCLAVPVAAAALSPLRKAGTRTPAAVAQPPHLQKVVLNVCLQAGQPQAERHPQYCAGVAVQHLLLQVAGARLQRRCHLHEAEAGQRAGGQAGTHCGGR